MFRIFIIFIILQVCFGYIQYIPPVMGVVNWCNLNPHNCVRTITNGWQNILDTIDHKAEAIRKQAMFESMFEAQRQQLTGLQGSFPADPWKTIQVGSNLK
jgi:hypothetical protein